MKNRLFKSFVFVTFKKQHKCLTKGKFNKFYFFIICMVSMHCRKCGYRKERENIPEKCPYCDARGTLAKDPSVQDIIDNVTEEDF